MSEKILALLPPSQLRSQVLRPQKARSARCPVRRIPPFRPVPCAIVRQVLTMTAVSELRRGVVKTETALFQPCKSRRGTTLYDGARRGNTSVADQHRGEFAFSCTLDSLGPACTPHGAAAHAGDADDQGGEQRRGGRRVGTPLSRRQAEGSPFSASFSDTNEPTSEEVEMKWGFAALRSNGNPSEMRRRRWSGVEIGSEWLSVSEATQGRRVDD